MSLEYRGRLGFLFTLTRQQPRLQGISLITRFSCHDQEDNKQYLHNAENFDWNIDLNFFRTRKHFGARAGLAGRDSILQVVRLRVRFTFI
jgi:hypothetical protein